MTPHEKEEAVRFLTAAVALRPRSPGVYFNLGRALANVQQMDEAIAYFKKAVEIDPKYAVAHCDLGLAWMRKGRIDEAVACFERAVEIDPMYATAHFGLGTALAEKGRIDEAVACLERAVEIDPMYALAHFDLGVTLKSKGNVNEAVASFRRAVALGYEDARPALAMAEHMAAAEEKFADFLSGRYKPTTNQDRLVLAEICQAKRRNHATAQLYADALAADPELADDLKSSRRYNAACHASLASAAQGEDAAKLDDAEKARLRKQALGWLHSKLALWAKQLGGSPANRAAVQKMMTHWRKDGDLASIREADALAKLPDAERKEWQKLWGDVEALLKRAGSVSPGPRPSSPNAGG